MNLENKVTVKLRDAFAARHEPEAARVLGEFLWVCIVCMVTVCVLGSVAYGYWEWRTPLAEMVEPSTTVGERKTITRTELVQILEAFDARAKEYEARRIQAVPLKDPS